MSGGIFLLLCLLAFFIGTRALKSRTGQLSPKAIKQRQKIKVVLMWASFILVLIIMILYFPEFIKQIMIAFDTHFDWDVLLSLVLFGFAIFTVITIYRAIQKEKKKFTP
ncbi:MAG: hypothetical protein JEZ09_05430 [Salinivirgaceae bacterium]|nr:hypothetical protein [Salinivirgaceae bacterium]